MNFQKRELIFLILLLIFLIPLVSAGVPEDFLNLINAERASLGRGPLSINSELTTAGQLHSQDMIDQDYFSHTSLDGRSFVDRIIAAGYTGYVALGENIAYHGGSPDAATVFEQWRNSPGHYSNMISSYFTEMGLGVVYGEYNGYQVTMYTLDLGKRNIVCTDGQTRECGQTNIGVCEYGIQTCSGGNWGSCEGAVYPVDEICGNELDDNCEGSIDEFCNCEPQALSACYSRDVYWYDSCERREDRKEDCLYGCSEGVCINCDSHSLFSCYNNDVYWYNACEVREDKKQECGTTGCSGNECCEDHATTQCYNNDAYWYSSCGYRQERKEDCSSGCSEGVCINCDSHTYTGCFYNDVYWYDSCERREDRKEDCLYGCSEGECNAPPCELNPEICNGEDDNCNREIDEGDVCLPLELEIVFPEQNNIIFSRHVNLDVELTKRSEMLSIYDNGRKIGYCRNCDSFEKRFNFRTGEHLLEIEAHKGEETAQDSVSFEVYIPDLRIYTIYPRSTRRPVGKDGEISAMYRSAKPVTASLLIDSGELGYEELIEEKCPAGRREYCYFNPTIPEGIQGEAEITLELEDDMGANVSKTATVLIDTKDPELEITTETHTTSRSKRLRIIGELSEKATVTYVDDRGYTRRLASRRDHFSRYFRLDPEETLDLELTVTDLAGNQVVYEFTELG